MNPVAESWSWRLTTFNIQYAAAHRWLRKRESLAKVLADLQPDVLCLQEVSATGLTWLRTKLGNPPCFAAGREDGDRSGEHVPVFLLNPTWARIADGTFWFSPTPDRPSVGWGSAHPRICTWVKIARPAAPDLTVFNVHLDHRSPLARAESGRLLQRYRATVAKGALTVVCGDFNERRADRVITPFHTGQPPLYDVAIPAGVTVPTWRGWSRLGLGRARLDYVLADSRLRLRNYTLTDNATVGRTLSDHKPISVDLMG